MPAFGRPFFAPTPTRNKPKLIGSLSGPVAFCEHVLIGMQALSLWFAATAPENTYLSEFEGQARGHLIGVASRFLPRCCERGGLR